MNHILILVGVTGLFVGVWALVVASKAHRLGGPSFLSQTVRYLLFTNLLATRIVIDLYARTNLIADSNHGSPLWYTMTTYWAAFIIRVFLLMSVVRLAETLLERTAPKAVTLALWSIIGTVGLGHVIGATAMVLDGNYRWQVVTEAGFAVGVGIVGIGILIGLSAGRHAQLSRERRSAVRRLATPLVAGYLLLLLAFVVLRLSTWIAWQAYLLAVAATLLWQNGTFLLWLETVFPKTYVVAAPVWSVEVVDALARQHQITKREREIMDLILVGRSNKEIESTLLISVHTVKNHIYNLYKKLGINSRGQMIRMLSERGRRQ